LSPTKEETSILSGHTGDDDDGSNSDDPDLGECMVDSFGRGVSWVDLIALFRISFF